jgi:hypothetical protein
MRSYNRLLKLQADLDAELRRIGVTWDAIRSAVLAAHPAETAAGQNSTIVKIPALMPLLREVPNGAGLEAFLAHCGHLFGTGEMNVRVVSTDRRADS